MMGFGMMGGGFISLLIIGLIIYLFVRDSNINTRDRYHHRSNNALDILKERYAKGEISEEEYERKKNILRD
ncbi:SHOCT domain-containing protein [Sporosalibacterium faouarense]|uniref:SHOCT domain-containing protein n=1 Tax=Sporosalibacterium faouarense TaxID=516123 RepID=UPI00141D6CCE|nr:SHOCT domain-containing protein [Sporosalibacterium faouarense]MTI48529.1 SHOCT domain-containing protein [Bacillota bacterium]